MNIMKARITISLDEEIIEKIADQKEISGASVSFLINRILKKEFNIK